VNDLRIGEHDVLSVLRPDSLIGALAYLCAFVVLAVLLSRALHAAVHAAMTRDGHVDRTGINFIQQFGTVLIWVVVAILYAHLIPVLRALGTALLAGAGVVSVVLGLAAQSTLGNLIAGLSITIYRPFRLGDTLQVTAPTGTEVGVVESISLGYTTLRTPDGRRVVLPNALAASQVVLNVSSVFVPWQMSVAIRIAREADVEAACRLALTVATETLGEKAVSGCFLTKVDSTAAVLELRFQAPDAVSRDASRAKVLAALAQRFAQTGMSAAGSERPSFS
jgi:small-conductance mechanosensitive channel